MAKWVHSDVLDNGIAYIKNNCNSQIAIISYTPGDSYSTVTNAANIVAEVAMSSGDFTLSTVGSSRRLTTASGKQDTAASNTGDPTHIAFVDKVNSKVLWVTSETSVQSVTAGNPVNFPNAVEYTKNQPV